MKILRWLIQTVTSGIRALDDGIRALGEVRRLQPGAASLVALSPGLTLGEAQSLMFWATAECPFTEAGIVEAWPRIGGNPPPHLRMAIIIFAGNHGLRPAGINVDTLSPIISEQKEGIAAVANILAGLAREHDALTAKG